MTTQQNLGGRPEVGPAFSLRFPAELIAQVDGLATTAGTSRAAWLRQAAEDRVAITREELAPFVEWLLEEHIDHSEVARVIEKPRSYQDWLDIYRAGGSLDDLDETAAGE